MNAGPLPADKDCLRAGSQPERILCAAQKCFMERGFHAASMASIAATAGMSVGLLYRYFENKNAIVLAIIERQLQEGRAQLARLHSSSDLAAELADAFARWQVRDAGAMNAALFLEVTAEGARDPQVAAALQASDKAMLAELEAWMKRGRGQGGLGLPPEVVTTRAFLLQSFVNGLMVSAVRLGRDGAPARAAIERVVERLLSP